MELLDKSKLNYLRLLLLFLVLISPGCKDQAKNPVDYVDPNIGTIGHLLRSTYPLVYLPHSEVRLAPHTTPGIRDRYLADKIYGFPLGMASMMVTTGNLVIDEDQNASLYDHDHEKATPYYYNVLLEDYQTEVEYSVTEHAAIYRLTFNEDCDANILVSLRRKAQVKIIDSTIVEGYETSYYRITEPDKNHFYCEFNKPFKSSGSWKGPDIRKSEHQQTGDHIGVFVQFSVRKSEQIEIKIGFSNQSSEQAQQFLTREIPLFNFDRVKDRARKTWNEALSKIEIIGGSDEQRTIFYTALYRTMGRKGNVWDTYRCAYPLQTIIEADTNMAVIRRFIKEFEESGWLPSSGTMIGNHAAPVIVDAYMKELQDFDVETAYEGMKKNAMEATMIPWRDRGPITELDKIYFEKGFFPALPGGKAEWISQVDTFERRQSVAVTLEHCYDDWCLAQMARVLNKNIDYDYFMKRAHNYQTLYDARIGFMAPKTADGKWVEPFDPKLSGGQGGRAYFAECNSWIYTWHVQHDMRGLIDLMGGQEKFVQKLDALFVEQYGMLKFKFLNQFPDATGLIGQYAQGNEPSFHIPYLYNHAGAPWKTQRRVREIMKIWYDDGPLGICGDEDGGSMSAWYVFSAMGFYPFCPGRPVYDIGSPVFEQVTIKVGDGKKFVIRAKNVSAKNKYIQSATLNGKKLNKPWFEHAALVKGGELLFNMGDRPNKDWGSAADAAPPSGE